MATKIVKTHRGKSLDMTKLKKTNAQAKPITNKKIERPQAKPVNVKPAVESKKFLNGVVPSPAPSPAPRTRVKQVSQSESVVKKNKRTSNVETDSPSTR